MLTSADVLPPAEQETFAERKKRLFEEHIQGLADKAEKGGVGISLSPSEAEMAEETAEQQRDEVNATFLRGTASRFAESEGVTQSLVHILSKPADQLLANRWGQITDELAGVYGGEKADRESGFTSKVGPGPNLAFLGPAITTPETDPHFKTESKYFIVTGYEFNDAPLDGRKLALGKLVFALRHIRAPKP